MRAFRPDNQISCEIYFCEWQTKADRGASADPDSIQVDCYSSRGPAITSNVAVAMALLL